MTKCDQFDSVDSPPNARDFDLKATVIRGSCLPLAVTSCEKSYQEQGPPEMSQSMLCSESIEKKIDTVLQLNAAYSLHLNDDSIILRTRLQ